MEGFRIDLKTFWAWLCLTNAPKLSESKHQADFGVIIWGQNPQAFMIPIYSTTVLYDTEHILAYIPLRQSKVYSRALRTCWHSMHGVVNLIPK